MGPDVRKNVGTVWMENSATLLTGLVPMAVRRDIIKEGVKEVEPATQYTLIHLSNNIDDLFAFPDYIEIR